MLVNKLLLSLLFGISIYANNYGSLLFNGNCVTCHNETKSISAPSIIEVQQHYKRAFSEKKEFINYMSNWVMKPKKETSIMLDAVNKYSLMPELAFSMETLEEISAYIYDANFTKKND